MTTSLAPSSANDPLTYRPVALVDLLDRVLATGVVVSGDITLAIADVDLVRISLRALIASVGALAPPEPAAWPSADPGTATSAAADVSGAAAVGTAGPVPGAVASGAAGLAPGAAASDVAGQVPGVAASGAAGLVPGAAGLVPGAAGSDAGVDVGDAFGAGE
ncbi:gas vesicle protein [Micromonospora avicenniae]|uniref:gas vesicle protein n=1 Tax=Micromonospora avicenniae TaxID=1198245 RepID=UPI0034332C3A